METLENQVFKEQVRLIYRQIPGVIFATTSGAILLAFLHWKEIPTSSILIWASCTIFSTSVNPGILQYCYHRYYRPGCDASIWAKWYIFISFLGGLTWGSSAFLLYAHDNMVLQVVLLLFLFTAVAMTALTLTAHKLAFYVVAGPMLIPIAIKLAMDTTSIHWLLSATTLVFLTAIVIFHYTVHHGLTESIRLWYEKNELAKNLKIRSDEVERESVAKSRFLAAASHDLRQPLVAQELLIDELKRRVGDADGEELFNKIKSNITSLHALFNELVEVSRLDVGDIVPKKVNVDLGDIVLHMKEQFSPMANVKNIKLMSESSSVEVYTDPTLLRRILQNLISNAIKYTDKGEVSISHTQNNNQIRIDILDTGVGLAIEEQKTIFDEFYRSSNTSGKQEGFGLGLAIVKRLSKLLNHEIEVESRPDKGSRFSVIINQEPQSEGI